jgi:antitoxin (DNA-binding transcriptional repressor) of toxin-antitoxin stability system
MKIKTISISQAREKLAEITQNVTKSGDEYNIIKHGKVIAKIVPPNTTTKISSTFEKNLDNVIEEYRSDLEKLSLS